MKKIIALVLILVMCLGLTACGKSEDQKAFEAANALLEAGDYQAALDAYRAIPLYAEIDSKVYQIEEQLRAEKVSFLTGTWKDMKSEVVLTFGEGGKFTIQYTDGSVDEAVASYDDNGTLFVMGECKVEEIDGVTHLVGEYFDFVSAADYEVVGPKTYEITMENWAEYFEIRDAMSIYRNDFGDISNMGYGFGIFLKDEYVSRLKDPYMGVSASFKVTFDEVIHHATGSEAAGDLEMGEAGKPAWLNMENERRESFGEIWLQEGEYMEGSSSYGCYATTFTGYTTIPDPGDTYIVVFENPEITDVIGTISLLP